MLIYLEKILIANFTLVYDALGVLNSNEIIYFYELTDSLLNTNIFPYQEIIFSQFFMKLNKTLIFTPEAISIIKILSRMWSVVFVLNISKNSVPIKHSPLLNRRYQLPGLFCYSFCLLLQFFITFFSFRRHFY